MSYWRVTRWLDEVQLHSDVVKITFVVLQSIAYIIKTDAMSHVAIYHADNMTPYAECPDSYLDSLFVQF